MGNQPQKPIEFLEYFCQFVSERDWQNGLDLFSHHAITDLSSIHHLVIGKVEENLETIEEVRLKVHPNGQFIQWIECTCHKNRVKNIYCEHIVSFIMVLNQKRPDLIKLLQTSKNFIPKPTQKRYSKEVHISQSSSFMRERLLDRIKDSIEHAELLSDGRISVFVQGDTKPSYILSIDESATFIQVRPDIFHGVNLYRSKAIASTWISSNPHHEITVQKVLAMRNYEKESFFDVIIDKIVPLPESNTKEWSFYTGSFFIGQEHCFIPLYGYITVDGISKEWKEQERFKTYVDDQAGELIATKFLVYKQRALLFLDSALSSSEIEHLPGLESLSLEADDKGWFYLDPKYSARNESFSVMDWIRKHYGKKQKYIHHKGQWFHVPEFLKDQNFQIDLVKNKLKLDALELVRFQAAHGEFDQYVGSNKALDFLKGSQYWRQSHERPSLDHTKLSLRPYQEEGLDWFWWLYKNRFHGLLADDMGLGKTHQAMAMMSSIQKEKPNAQFLVVCPTTVIGHWESKILEFAPNLNPFVFYGQKRIRHIQTESKESRTFLTTYGIVLRDIVSISQVDWEVLILDEAHFVKNHKTATYQSVCQIKSRMRICLTGTPLENHLGELKTIFDFLIPGYLGSHKFFRKSFQKPIEDGQVSDPEVLLQKLIHPFKMRRTKKEVLADLPEKIEDIRYALLSEDQTALYQNIIELRVKPLVQRLMREEQTPIPYLHVFSILQLLKQVCNHPALIQDKGLGDFRVATSGKFELLKQLLRESLDSNNKIVIFSQYVGMIQIIKAHCDAEGIGVVTLTGQTQKRHQVIQDFQENPKIKIFVGSLLAGGIGVDLTAASVVIHYDRWWNSSKENQATDRVHRIGQKNFVQVFKLITRGTLEEKIDLMIQKKQGLFDKFLEQDEDLFKTMSRKDVISLLQTDE